MFCNIKAKVKACCEELRTPVPGNTFRLPPMGRGVISGRGGWVIAARRVGGYLPPPSPSTCHFRMAILGTPFGGRHFRMAILGTPFRGRHFRMAILGDVYLNINPKMM